MRSSKVLAATVMFPSALLLTARAVQADSPTKPMITHNPDGTFTAQKELPNMKSKDAKATKATKATKGLVIPPQIVVPIAPIPRKKQ